MRSMSFIGYEMLVTERAKNIIDNFKSPEKFSKTYENVVLTYEGEGNERIYTFTPIVDLDEDIRVDVDLDYWDVNIISFGASDIISNHLKENRRYVVISSQTSYNLLHSETKKGKAFRKLNDNFYIYNREVYKEPNLVFPDPLVYEENGQFEVDGKKIELKLDRADHIANLIKAKLFKEPKHEISRGGIYSFEKGYVSARSRRVAGKACFLANSPFFRASKCAVVFEKTNKTPEIPMREIAERKYQAFLKNEEELNKIKPIVEDFRIKLESARKAIA